jgi:putative sugar O-methyltransferase
MNVEKLSGLGMWEKWQEKVKESLPNFAADPIYVSQNSYSESQFKKMAKEVAKSGAVDIGGKIRDSEFGGRVVETELGGVTRMWLDGNVEIDFLRRNVPDLKYFRVLDIGAGYGRLAVMLAPFVQSITCVDPVPISEELCRDYTRRFAPDVRVLSIGEFVESPPEFDLAINIHSWNECLLEQVENWIEALVELKVQYLFTVSHGDATAAYKAWFNGSLPSFRPAIEKYYTLIKEEILALEGNPHALWFLK